MTSGWPITATVLHSELRALQDIAERWAARFGDPEFLASFDEMDDFSRAQMFAQMQNELKVAAAKSATLVEVLA
jgi:hypothetical protein